MKTKERIIVGMSGGVDSSVAALLLLEQGYDVQGLFMKNWEDDDTPTDCTATEDRNDAKLVCQELGIPLHFVNFSREYKENVFSVFLREYAAGRTPNPDVLCNREIKFHHFLHYARRLGASRIATGHYARVDCVNGEFRLLKGLDTHKDQTYFLHLLNQEQLRSTLFPVGELTKAEVRQLAEEAGFENFSKKDSTGICFIGERDFKSFLSRYLEKDPGEMVTSKGEVVGRHDGLSFYTLGQRKGLGIGGRADATDDPWFVAGKDRDTNRLIVVQGHNHPTMLSHCLWVRTMHWINGHPPPTPFECCGKVRYLQPDQRATVTALGDDYWKVEFDRPQWAVTPGQSLVLYHEDICLGGGIIDSIAPVTAAF